ncbi:unnamed protein product [Phyllotreta striolata]|uniref:CN hydrolase domain-containing protein n=1 Tax=Phyllotreta striolata TaxID=444603 RepID=A0A9N9XJP0_PHYSR|nr:unnamed protein product [Phyllotreta striolata]
MASVKLFLLTLSIFGQSYADYVAAVVEYQPLFELDLIATVESNLQQFVNFIKTAKKGSAQIIVFPEYGLTGWYPNVTNAAIEIPDPPSTTTNSHSWLQRLSNAALTHSIYVALNLLEKSYDENNNIVYYNAAIVFDSHGKLVAKYRKINLFRESYLTPGDFNQNHNVFTTDFGVTFGIFTCFDIVYYDPAIRILNNPSVTDVIFPTAWLSILPFFHSLTVQFGYSLANKVNLLAANINNVKYGVGGSGIYGGNGSVLSYYISGNAGSKLQIATVKKVAPAKNTKNINHQLKYFDNKGANLSNYYSKKYFDFKIYTFKKLNLSQLVIKEDICYKGFCCTFEIFVSSSGLNSSEIYQIMAYNGPATIGEPVNIKLCSLVACETPDLRSCGSRNTNLKTNFTYISVEFSVPRDDEGYYLPVSLTKHLAPVLESRFETNINEGNRTSKYYIEKTIDNIIAFGIAGNGALSVNVNLIMFVSFICLSSWVSFL